MAARVTQHVLEAIIPVIARDPATPTGAGVTQHLIEALIANPGKARVTQHVLEAIISFNPDGSHGDTGGGGTPTAGTTIYGWG